MTDTHWSCLGIPPHTPPCSGRWELFDSVHAADHMEARALCATCPVIDACRQLAANVASTAQPKCGPQGTWAGQLLIAERTLNQRREEEARWSDDAARAARNRYEAGHRDPVSTEGKRVWERRRRNRRAAA